MIFFRAARGVISTHAALDCSGGADNLSIRAVRVVRGMAEIFIRKHVARSAAALSYYLTISIFPLLICLSAILGSFQIQESDAFAFLEGIISTEAFSAISEFLRYVGSNRSDLMFIIGVIAMLTSSSAAFRSFTGIMGEIQGKMRFSGLRKGIFSFIFSIALLAAIYVSALVIMSGGWLIQILEDNFGFGRFLSVWTWIRFFILFFILFAIIFGVYLVSAPKETRRMHRLPGAFCSSVVLVVASVAFSRLISASLRYAILYGSLASFVILMIWLYVCGIILIMGNVLNISLHENPEVYSSQ